MAHFLFLPSRQDLMPRATVVIAAAETPKSDMIVVQNDTCSMFTLIPHTDMVETPATIPLIAVGSPLPNMIVPLIRL